MKALRSILIGLAGLLLLVAVGMAWLVGTTSGARVALKIVRARIPGDLAVGRVDGALVGPLVLEKVEYRPPGGRPPILVDRTEIDLAAKQLFRRRIDVLRASFAGVLATLPESTDEGRQSPPMILPPIRLPELRAPWPIELRELLLTDLRVRRAEESLLHVGKMQAKARWIGNEIQLDRFDASGPQGTASLRGRLASGDALRLDAKGSFHWELGGRVFAAELDSRTDGGRLRLDTRLSSPLLASATATLVPAANRWTLGLEVPEFDPRGPLFSPTSGLAELAVQLKGDGGAGSARFTGTIGLNGETIRLDSLEAELEPEGARVTSLAARLNDHPGTVRAEGLIRPAANGPEFDLRIALRQLILPATWTRQDLEASGEFQARGSTTAYLAEGDLRLGPPGRPSRLEFSLKGTREKIQLEPLRVLQPEGRLSLSGVVHFKPVRWDVAAEAEQFDPGEFLPDWTGRIAGHVRSTGRAEAHGPHFDLAIEQLTGRLRDRPIQGSGSIAFSPSTWLTGELQLESGDACVRVRSTDAEAQAAQVELTLPVLQDWLPGATGSLQARALLRGKWPDLGIAGEATGRDLAFGNVRVGALEVTADLPHVRRPAGRLRANLRRGQAGPLSFDDLQVDGSGDERAHELAITAEGAPLRARIALNGSLLGERWNGSLQALDFRWAGFPAFSLQEPVAIVAARDGSLETGRASFVGGDVRLSVAGSRSPAGAITAEGSLHEMPLAVIDEFVPGGIPTRLEGRVSAEARMQRAMSGALSGELRITSPSATAMMQRDEQSAGALPAELVLYRDLRIEASSDGMAGRATLQAGISSDGRLRADFDLAELGGDDARVAGTIEAALPTLAPVAALLPQVPGLAGRVNARVEVAGPLRGPEISGRIDAADLQAEIPRLGLRLREGMLRAEPGPRRSIQVSGAIRSGDGRVALEGTWMPGRDLRATLKGERFLAADLPAARVLVTPDLTLAQEPAGFSVQGTALIPEAAVNLQQLPQGRAQRRSRDVVVVDRPEEARQRSGIPLQAEVVVILGSAVSVTGFGLDAQLGGRLTVLERPGTSTTAAGEVSIAGTYQGYGQDLRITRGRVLYAGTPIADPQLDITAERELEQITAGVRISGTARAPELHVLSRPDMGEADALSYLVTGKPLSGVASPGESDLLNSAARSLGTAAGSLLAERIGRRLGIDEVGIEESDMIEGGVFTIGEYLSPRLYVAYGVGLFEPGDLVTLRYELTDALNLRAVRGPDETRAGVEYKVER